MTVKKINIMAGIALFAALSLFGPEARGVEAFPARSLEMSVVFSPGGALDVLARALATEVERTLGWNIVVRNEPGGGGMPGVARLSASGSEGYSLAACVSNALVFIPQRNPAPYRPLRDVEAVIGFGQATPVLLVRPDSVWESMNALLEAGKGREVRIGVPGLGTPSHVALAVMAETKDASWRFIPYGGPGEAEAALMGGHIDAATSGALPRILDGQFRPLAALGGARIPALPEVPCLPDLGFADPGKGDSVFLLLVPAGVPEATLALLEETFLRAAQSEAFKQTARKFTVSPLLFDRKQSRAFLEQAWKEETATLKSLGLSDKPATEPR